MKANRKPQWLEDVICSCSHWINFQQEKSWAISVWHAQKSLLVRIEWSSEAWKFLLYHSLKSLMRPCFAFKVISLTKEFLGLSAYGGFYLYQCQNLFGLHDRIETGYLEMLRKLKNLKVEGFMIWFLGFYGFYFTV